jgi:hypothetical protein
VLFKPIKGIRDRGLAKEKNRIYTGNKGIIIKGFGKWESFIRGRHLLSLK